MAWLCCGVEILAGQHTLEFAAVELQVVVVKIRGDPQADVGRGVNRQDAVVKVEQVRVVLVDQVDRPVEKFLGVGGRELRGGAVQRSLRPAVFSNLMVLGVVILGIEPLPPQSLAVGLGHSPVVLHPRHGSHGVGARGLLVPAPGAVAVAGHRKFQACRPHRLLPAANEASLGPDGDGVPRLEGRVKMSKLSWWPASAMKYLAPARL